MAETDEFCANCGIIAPARQFSPTPAHSNLTVKILGNTSFRIGFALILMFLILFAATYFSFFDIFELGNYIFLFFISLIIGFLTAFLSTYCIREWIKAGMNRIRPKKKGSLTSAHKIIELRLGELNERIGRIDLVLSQIKETDGRNLQEVRKTLLTARSLVSEQSARYEIQAKKIEMARLQNGVRPFLNNLHRLSDREAEHGLRAIEKTQNEIGRLRQNQTNDLSIEFPKAVQPARDGFLMQLRETEESCGKLREALLSKQATRAVRGISPIEENLHTPDSGDIAHALEIFNIESTLTDFSESFEDLETEYKRLRAEKEVTGKLVS